MTEVTNTAPLGGTELILGYLKAALPDLCDKVQIIQSRPEQTKLEDKPRILWLQDLPQDPASARLRDRGYRKQFNRIVFNSFWQQQMYNAYLGIPFSEGITIKNGVPRLTPTLPKPKTDDKLKFLYTSTPHRGLAVLAGAADALAKERQDWELHIYSSLNIYGWHEADNNFTPLYEKLQQNPCVVYHGTQPNAVVRQACLDSHVFVYPSIYIESSCMAIQEAMMAGCLAITSTLGALIETCGEWAWMIPFTENFDHLAQMTYSQMIRAFKHYDDPGMTNYLTAQSDYYQNFYSFETRVPAWKVLLESVVSENPKEESFIIE